MADDTLAGPWNDYQEAPSSGGSAAPSSSPGPWDEYAGNSAPKKVGVGEDVTRGITQNAVPTALTNIGAGVVNAPYTIGSYILQLGTKGGEYLGEGADSLVRAAQGEPQKTQKEYDSEQLDLMNAIRGKLGMQPTTSGDISQLVPTPQKLLEAGTEAVGHPLYQPQTTPGQLTTGAINMASAGAGSGVKLADALSGALGATTFQETVKQLGGPEAAQFAAGLIGGGLGAKASESGLGEDTPMSRQEDQAINDIFAKAPPKNPQGLGSEDLRAMAKPAYDYAEQKGGVLSPEGTDTAIQKFKDNITESSRVTRALGKTDAHKFVEGIEAEYGGTPMTLNDATDIIQRLNDGINTNVYPKTGKLNSVGKQLYGMKTDFMDLLNNAADNGQVSGGPAAFDAWRQGQDLWARSARAGEIERIIGRGIDMETGQPIMDNPDTSIRVGFRNLYNNKKLFNQYTDAEQQYIQKASQTGVGGELLRAAGSRLATQGLLAMGNIPAALGNVILSKGWRDIAGRARAGQGQQVIDEIVAGAKAFTPPPEQLQLPPPQPKLPPPSMSDQYIAGPEVGNIRPVGDTEAFARNQQRQGIANMGRSPDVEAAGAQHPGAAPEPPEVTQARQNLQSIAATGKPTPQPAQFRPQSPPQADQNGQVPIPQGQGPLQWDAQGRPFRGPPQLAPPKGSDAF